MLENLASDKVKNNDWRAEQNIPMLYYAELKPIIKIHNSLAGSCNKYQST